MSTHVNPRECECERDRDRELERKAQRAKKPMIWNVNHRNHIWIIYLIQATQKTNSLKIELGVTLQKTVSVRFIVFTKKNNLEMI